MDIYQSRIRPLFDGSGLTDKQLEAALQLPRGVIYKWGTGKYKSYKTYIPQIAAYFHVSTDYLMGATDDPSPADGQKEKPASSEGSGLSPAEESLIQLFRLVPKESQAMVTQMIEAALKSQGLLP